MPSVGQTTDELVIVEWLKKVGDTVALGESLFSVQTDKAQVEVESVAAGTLLKVLRDAGATVRAGSAVAYIGAAGEVVPDSHVDVEGGGGSGPADNATGAAAVTERPVPMPAPAVTPERRAPEATPGRVAALPAARRLATELGVDVNEVAGTGPDGVITVHDVEQAAAAVAKDGGADDLT
jgi:pyruvate dehydrogenase E2 component (dihydrolipoamide acetyltransferase)